ncbi:MAG: hypothetical protein H6Q00_1402 [Holophagaceae bacterium]|nr:hypothetical protein [Holophagaceae bacterium]
MSQLPSDVCRCEASDCHQKEVCARHMDKGEGDAIPHADFSPIITNGQCRNFIYYEES